MQGSSMFECQHNVGILPICSVHSSMIPDKQHLLQIDLIRSIIFGDFLECIVKKFILALQGKLMQSRVVDMGYILTYIPFNLFMSILLQTCAYPSVVHTH
jgi:hypothetical protein